MNSSPDNRVEAIEEERHQEAASPEEVVQEEVVQEEADQEEAPRGRTVPLGYFFRRMVFSLVAILALVWYVDVLFFGENSLRVLSRLTQEKAHLLTQSHALKLANQKLQKKYFELIQLNSD